MSGFLRSLFVINKPIRSHQTGFVLPTTVLLLLIMTLTVGALTFRTVSRTQSAFLDREQQVIDNVASPAVDRAKSKLEYLFSRDTRMPGTNTPSSDVLSTLMLNVDSLGTDGLGLTALGTDPYTLPDETRIDINNDGTLDNAWSFSFDLDGNGAVSNEEIIAYSVLMDDAVDPKAVDGNSATMPTATRDDDIKIEDTGPAETIAKANSLVTRNGPINTNNAIASCGGNRAPSEGWLTVNPTALEKNFQITAFVSNGKDPGRTNSAVELQQVRLAQRGNTWGAWFKYDMEIHPGPQFNWNGAIHTDGNLFVTNNFRGHMISSHNSCLYTQQASAITMAQVDNDGDGVLEVGLDDPDFQGQLVAGVPGYSRVSRVGNPGFHIFNGLRTAPTLNNNLRNTNDSVEGADVNDLYDIAIDPVALFTKNLSKHRRTSGWQRDPGWETNDFNVGGRVTNQNQNQPFLDDFYRADNRYGPRPNYSNYNWVTDTDDGTVNTNRANAAYDKQLGEEIIDTDPRAFNLTNGTDGLDGYWERKAINNGLRMVIGQRLELGNHLGWNFTLNGGTTDPLYPTELDDDMANKQKQRVTLRDNLAAVQGMVVYHYDTNDGQYPLACIANTAHPGTLQTLRASRTFESYAETGTVKTDFLQGQGTNGWEFSFPTAFDTEAEFGTALASNQPLGVALRNLAYFAGDPNGGSPSFAPRQNATVHPFPHQAMWGDFSILRRIFDERLDATTNTAATTNTPSIPSWRSAANPPQLTNMADRYSALSPADKSSLHSAACTLGLLAYNIEAATNEYQAIPSSGRASLNALGVQLAKLMDGNVSNGEIGTNTATNLCTGGLGSTGCPPSPYDPNYYSQFTADQWINALENDGALGANLSTAIDRAQLIVQRQQIERDRTLGFIPAGTEVGLAGTGTGYSAANGSYVYQGGGNPFSGKTFKVGCDPTSFATTGGNSQKAQLGLSMAFCSIAQGPKAPSLYYLFPTTNHSQVGTDFHTQPSTEEYIDQAYLADATAGINRGITYTVISGDVAAVSFIPRNSNGSNWVLPTTLLSTGTLNPESMNIKRPDGRRVALSLLDKVMYNGREEMAVRVLDVDLEKLTRTKNGGTDGDYWIADARDTVNGIVYAVREDAAREDSVTRPTSTANWTNCDTLSELLSATCWMRPSRSAASGGPTDPPLSERDDGSPVGISIKPIDFAPDPDRRSYGFRLNAALNGNNGDLSDRNEREWGFTFVTDNAAYLKGEFNPHTSNGNNTLEEFTQTLFNNAVTFGLPFYNNRTAINNNFSSDTVDRWRVAEVLADSVSLLSNNFIDGAVEEGFIRNLAEESPDFGNSRTSFHNQQRPVRDNDEAWAGDNEWYRVDGTRGETGGDTTIPIWVGRNGESMARGGSNLTNANDTVFDDATSGRFELPDQRSENALIDAAAPERINATIISGLTPSRSGQGYGGLHNFPRFLEDWNDDNLFIQGAFLQLNFNTSGTAPFDIEAWEPGDIPTGSQRINYYKPPSRRWGYDVGLQFSPAGPIAQRFVSIGRPRSEHYRELPIDDAYVTNLRCSKLENDGDRIFPNEGGCPQ